MTQGTRIKEIRRSLGLTLEKFGERLGVGKAAISKLEKGERNLTDQMAKSICREFNINEEWLRTGSGKMQAPVQDEVMAALSDLAESDTPFYTLLKRLLLAYHHSDTASRETIDRFLLGLSAEMELPHGERIEKNSVQDNGPAAASHPSTDIPQLSRLSVDEKVALYRQELEREEKAGERSRVSCENA